MTCRLPLAPPPLHFASFVDCLLDSLPSIVPSSSRPLRWIVFDRHCSRSRSRRGGRRGRIIVVVSTSPSSPATDRRAETCIEGPSIVSVTGMVAGGKDGLPWQRAGWQWLRLWVVRYFNIVARENRSVSVFRQKKNIRRRLMMILATSRHRPQYLSRRDIARIGDIL